MTKCNRHHNQQARHAVIGGEDFGHGNPDALRYYVEELDLELSTVHVQSGCVARKICRTEVKATFAASTCNSAGEQTVLLPRHSRTCSKTIAAHGHKNRLCSSNIMTNSSFWKYIVHRWIRARGRAIVCAFERYLYGDICASSRWNDVCILGRGRKPSRCDGSSYEKPMSNG